MFEDINRALCLRRMNLAKYVFYGSLICKHRIYIIIAFFLGIYVLHRNTIKAPVHSSLLSQIMMLETEESQSILNTLFTL